MPEPSLSPQEDVTTMLAALRGGDQGAFDRLLPLVYEDLRRRAHAQLSRYRPGETLSTTALVHEAYLKLAGSSALSFQDRVHFHAVASRAMRQLLVDYARRTTAEKRGGGRAVSLEVDQFPDLTRADELVALDEALGELQRLDSRLAQIVEMRFFGGLSVEETGELLGLSPRTVKRDWRKARALLYDLIRGEPGGSDGP